MKPRDFEKNRLGMEEDPVVEENVAVGVEGETDGTNEGEGGEEEAKEEVAGLSGGEETVPLPSIEDNEGTKDEAVRSEESVEDNIISTEEELTVKTTAVIPPLTKMREVITPYLPPPMIKAMHQIDPALEPYLGPEASMTLLGSLFLAAVVWRLMRVVSSSFSGKAIVDSDDDGGVLARVLKEQTFRETVLLCGASGAGKTRLFYLVCHQQPQANTVVSLRANVGFRDEVRFMDYPGHESAFPEQIVSDILNQPNLRIVLMIDSTKPVATAADQLFQILQNHCNQRSKKQTRPSVLVVCNKSDLPGCKNWRRIKIQLRTELERLLKTTTVDKPWWPPKKPLVLEEAADMALLSASLQDGTGVEALETYCFQGTLPEPTPLRSKK